MEFANSPGDSLRSAFATTAKGLANPKRLELLDLLAQADRGGR